MQYNYIIIIVCQVYSNFQFCRYFKITSFFFFFLINEMIATVKRDYKQGKVFTIFKYHREHETARLKCRLLCIVTASCFLYDRKAYSMQITLDLIASTFKQRSENSLIVDRLYCQTLVKSIERQLKEQETEECRSKILTK